MPKLKIFLVEDEKILRISLADELRDNGYEVEEFDQPMAALNAFQTQDVDIVITDIKMPGMDGIELLSRIKSIKPETDVIVITAFGSVDSAVAAMKQGAYDYITKPFKAEEMLLVLQRIQELRSVKQDNIQLRSSLGMRYNYDSYVGSSEGVKQIKQLVKTVAETDATVLITGETGTGKDLIANIIHYESPRKHKPIVKVSCAVLSRQIFESELFGHEKGAFTGAIKTHVGKFEQANGGTLFLDDVDDIPFDLQVKLLNVLQEKRVERVGGRKQIDVDVRVIASTKKDLKKMAQENLFREDLYYRLNVFPIHLPPLQNRRDDIPELARHFIKLLSPNKNISFSDDVLTCLKNYHWPGNVRELKNIIERLLLLSKNSTTIDTQFLPPELLCDIPDADQISIGAKPLDELMADIEARLIQQALRQTSGNQAKAAELLHIPASTLRTKLKKYRISSPN